MLIQTGFVLKIVEGHGESPSYPQYRKQALLGELNP